MLIVRDVSPKEPEHKEIVLLQGGIPFPQLLDLSL
jgi:hypothetical protein